MLSRNVFMNAKFSVFPTQKYNREFFSLRVPFLQIFFENLGHFSKCVMFHNSCRSSENLCNDSYKELLHPSNVCHILVYN